MQAQHQHHGQIKDPGPFVFPAGVTQALFALFVLGAIAFGVGVVTQPARAWYAFVHNHFYFMSLALGGLVIAAIQWLTGAMWSSTVRRVAESFSSYLPLVALTFLGVYFAHHQVYVWSHPEHVKGDIVLEGKAGYLSSTFFLIRNLVAVGIWVFFYRKLIGNSLAQDKSKDPALSAANRGWSPAFMILFAISFTMASFDQLMSLDPHWFSTMYGVYCFAGMLYSTFALTTVVVIYLKRHGALDGIVNDNHLHDLGKFMFAFTVFWAYIGFCQFMLIWYANMPEETGYYLTRLDGGWLWVTLFLAFGKFMATFFILLPRDAKRNETLLFRVGIWMLFAQWVDLLWLTQPELSRSGPMVSWIEIGTALGFLGLFGLVVTRFLSRHSVVAIGDPRLEESVHHHQQ